MKLLKNRYIQLALSFVVGGFVATLLLPEKIVIKESVKTEYVDKIIEIEKEVIKEVEVVREVEKIVKIKKVKTKITYPDGKIVETEVYESESEQVDRMRRLESERYEELLAQKEKEYRQEVDYLKIHYNPKRVSLYGGAGVDLIDYKDRHFLAGMTYALWGPFQIGLQVNTKANASVLFGIRF